MTTDDDLTFTIFNYLGEGRNLIADGRAVLGRARAGERPRSSARMVFDGVLPEIKRSRWLASTPEYEACGESLEALAKDLEALREEARGVMSGKENASENR